MRGVRGVAAMLVVVMFAAVTTAAAAAVNSKVDEPWGLQCPAACTCHAGPFQDVPLRRTLGAYDKHLTLDDPVLNASLPVRQAVCVVLSDTFAELLAALPVNTQALTLLQGADEDPVILTPDQLSRLHTLLTLEITAFEPAGVHLRSDALSALLELRLLSLTGVRLKGTIMEDAEELIVTTAPPIHPRRRLPPWEYFTDHHSEETPKIVFLKPAEVVPFSRFSEIRRLSELKTFTRLEKLILLRLHGADMADVTWEMFDSLENLQVLSLEGNGMAYLPDWSFYGAPRLRHLSIANNELLEISSTALVGLLELRSLDLSHNNLSYLSELSLPPFPQLVTADFRGNPIEEIFTSTFQVMNATETLRLGGSGMPLQLHPDMFQGLRALRRLEATDVTTPALDREILRGVPKLRELTLRGSIAILPYDSFAEVPKLERLVLRQCSLRAVSMDAFYGLYGLQELVLSHNQLSALPPNLLDQQSRLRELRLEGNKLIELPPGLLSVLPAKMIRLDDNPWDCSCDMITWNPTAINKERREGRYVYDKRASPLCATPERYRGWSVFDAMRRGFRCNKNPGLSARARALARPNAVPVEASLATDIPEDARARNVVPVDPVDNRTSNAVTPVPLFSPSTAEDTVSDTDATAAPSDHSNPSVVGSTSSTADFSSSSVSPSFSQSDSPSWSTPTGTTGTTTKRKTGPGRPHRRQQHQHRTRKQRLHQGDRVEGSMTKDGQYLLSDGKGGFIAVSKKAYKLAVEQRHKQRHHFTSTAMSAASLSTQSPPAA